MATFHPFTNLPSELRLKIYILSLPAARLVPLKYFSPTAFSQGHRTRKPFRGCTSTASIPPLLHVSRETRTLAAVHYNLSFNLAGPPGSFQPKVWFDTSCDVLFFDHVDGDFLLGFKNFLHCLMVVDRQELAKVKRLAVHIGLFNNDFGGGLMKHGRPGSTAASLAEFRRLKEFWDYVKTKFCGVEEVFFVCAGGEENIFSDQCKAPVDELEVQEEEEMGQCRVIRDGQKKTFIWDYTGLGERFETKLRRAAKAIQSQSKGEGLEEWTIPQWWVIDGTTEDEEVDINDLW
jgi:hypothetical protein